MLSIFFLFFLVSFIQPSDQIPVAERTRGCQHLNPGDGTALEFCSDKAETLLYWNVLLKENSLFSKVASIEDTRSIQDLCARYGLCMGFRHICQLPHLFQEKNFVCPSVQILTSPLAYCFRKFFNKQPLSADVAMLIAENTTASAIKKKCEMLNKKESFERLLVGVSLECGHETSANFKFQAPLLNYYYGCNA